MQGGGNVNTPPSGRARVNAAAFNGVRTFLSANPGPCARVNVETEEACLRVFYDTREMAMATDVRGAAEVWDNALRVTAETWCLPEGTRVLDFETEHETQCLEPRETPQLMLYPHGRMARAWRVKNGAVVMVFGDSPKELLNNSVALDGPRLPSVAVENTRWLRDLFIAGRAARTGVGTPAAQRAMETLCHGDVRWLRGEIGQFAMGMTGSTGGACGSRFDVSREQAPASESGGKPPHSIYLAGVTDAPRVWTLRLEDVLGEGFFTLTLWRDGLAVDGEEWLNREVEEIFQGVTRHDKPVVEMARGGGFVARLEPCHETEFRMLKGARE